MLKKLRKKHQEVSIHQKATTLNIIKREMLRDKIALSSFVFIVAFIIILIITSLVIDQTVALQRDFSLGGTFNQAPSINNILGTDDGGRDCFTVLMVAATNSLIITALATIISSVFGVIYGLISGYVGGRVDRFMMRIIEGITILPNIVILITLIAFTGGIGVISMFTYTVMISLVAWLGIARMVRTRIVQEKELEYVQASKTLGTSHIKIIFHQLLPNLSTVIIASMTLSAVGIIGMETGISFLGFGFPIEMPSLGTLLALARSPVVLRYRWWNWIPATILIVSIMFSINNVGNMLSRAADARQRRG